ncbi:hypothetical protein LPJ73_001556 [Coemansia sp. RSA 2703]|nr:hypothetical protein LPJ73_001556 [Coemansia sp. RSA 2703]KAJ2374107.1 hypothetical protein IW150_003285 [Coemansia sp. RSA 2607]KAJ2391842.1 hypothetical protein GGI05_002833 [Coemansia sp. RSA 2603]
MENSDMELDPVDDNTQQQEQQQPNRGVPFTPPHSTDHTPQRVSAAGGAGPSLLSDNMYSSRAGDSAAPESPAAAHGGFDGGDADFEYGADDMELELEQQQQQEQGYPSYDGSGKNRGGYGMPDDESTKLVHKSFFNNFSKDWMVLS